MFLITAEVITIIINSEVKSIIINEIREKDLEEKVICYTRSFIMIKIIMEERSMEVRNYNIACWEAEPVMINLLV